MRNHQHRHVATFAATTVAAILAVGAAKVDAAVDACKQTTPPTGGTRYTSDGVGNESGDGNHELWHDGGGSMTMTVYGKGAAFKAEWNNAGDFLARVGYRWNNGQSYDKYGNVVADYSFTKSGTGGGYSYIGIYGWSKNPLVEYYVCENGFWTTPPNAGALGGATSKGTLDIDGGTYDIYTYKRVNKPSIEGNSSTFDQFWSVRRTPRTCGTISLSEHWKKWAAVGMKLGNMYEAKMLVEAGGGQGSFDMTYATMQTNVVSGIESKPVSAPRILRNGGISWNNGKSGTISLVSLNGSVIGSARQDLSTPAVLSTANLTKGMYLVRFQAEGSAPETQKFLLD